MKFESDETFSRKEIQERFEKLFNRKMSAIERASLFLPADTENDKDGPTTDSKTE
jgi:hypothetical protein